MKKTVDEIVKELNLKKGTVENFRSILIDLNIISNNQSLDDTHVNVLKKIVCNKTESNTWKNLMYSHIYKEFTYLIQSNFIWQPKIIIEDLIWQIKNGKVAVNYLDTNNVDDFHVFCCIIDNFYEHGKHYEPYENSNGSDGNLVISFKVTNHELNSIYYIIGKVNKFTMEEEIHIFYNAAKIFNIMSCTYISGGDCEMGLYNDLWTSCKNVLKIK